MSENLKDIRNIKRYPNRKLYDTESSSYITLDQIADMVVQGQEIKVIDNANNQDITAATLTQVIFEQQKRSKNLAPVDALRKVIQQGEDGFIQAIAGE